LDGANLCIVDAVGQMVREAKVVSQPDVVIAEFRN
jgi:hypothetical protein